MSDDDLIDDQYQFVAPIASGNSSQVIEVVEKTSARHYAMKLLKKDVPEFKENRAIMKREAEIHKSLDHPLIVKFERFSSNRDNTYILMEHFRASNLKLQIKADTNKVHLQVRQLFEGVCSALAHVHQKGFVHRDVKPDNVLMNRVGEVRLCDFSLSSRQVKGLGKIFSGKLKTIQGTRTYIAPETIRRLQPTLQTDLYSLGVLFFEVLACKTPFQAPTPEELLQKHLRAEAPNPSEFNPNVSPEMDRLIAKMLKKKMADRPISADEVLAELRRIRIFKEDVVDEIAAKKASADDDALAMLSEVRLDSRADAKLKEMLETNPEFARKFVEEKQRKAKVKKAANDLQNDRIKLAEDTESARTKSTKKAAPAATAPPAQPQPIPQQMPMQGYPQGYPPNFPGYPQGYGAYPQAPMPMMPMPGMPQYPPSPQAGYPQQMQQPPMQATQPAMQTQQPAPPAVRPVAPAAPPRPAQPVVRQAPQPAQPTAANTAQRQTTPPSAPAKLPVPAAVRSAPQPPPPAQPATDLDFMTDLPDVL